MPIIKIQGGRQVQNSELNALIDTATAKLSKFCTTKLQEFGVVTNKFTFEFEFNKGKRVFQKSSSRLVSVLKRKMTSENPYIEKCSKKTQFVQVVESTSGVFMVVNLLRQDIYSNKGYTSTEVTQMIENDLRHIARYVDYINRLCVNHNIPIYVVAEPAGIGSDEITYKGEPGWRHQYKVVISAYMGTRGATGSLVSYPVSGEMKTALVGDPALGNSKYLPPEAIFTVVPHILKVFKTLTRETDYDYTAFGVERTESE